MSQTHKDYMPSEGICEIGTNIRSLAASERRADLTKVVYANRAMDRQLRTGDVLSAEGILSDRLSRLEQYRETFCHTADNADGLELLCDGSGPQERRNKDIDYTRTIETQLTIDSLPDTGLDFTTLTGEGLTPDEEDVFALTANLFAHDVLPGTLTRRILNDQEGNPREGAFNYLALRSVAAKRSVAHNSFMSILADRSRGNNVEAAPFLKSIIDELEIDNVDLNIDVYLGENPSYFAQMEVLTKKLYQNPEFYTELYDKPTNVLRKGTALRALGLMQDRDMYHSLLRSEAVLSVLLETMLHEEQERVHSAMKSLKKSEDPVIE